MLTICVDMIGFLIVLPLLPFYAERLGASPTTIGALVSIRAEALRQRDRDDRYTCRAHILKDKRRGPGWQHKEVFRGPDGLR